MIATEWMYIELFYVQKRWEYSERPKEKVSRHAGCLATLGLTLLDNKDLNLHDSRFCDIVGTMFTLQLFNWVH